MVERAALHVFLAPIIMYTIDVRAFDAQKQDCTFDILLFCRAKIYFTRHIDFVGAVGHWWAVRNYVTRM